MVDDEQEEPSSDGLEEFGRKFYVGTLLKLQRGRQRGVVRAASGKEIPFEFVHAILLGDRLRWEDMHEGMQVAYDVGWTSRGLRVTSLRLVD